MARWVEQRPELIAHRYDRLAPFYGTLEWLYLLRLLGVRRKSVSELRLRQGDTVLEVGCGSGSNFPLLERAVGPGGIIFGVDLSGGMLARAKARCSRHGWSNVEMTQADALSYQPRVQPRAALFSFSYSAIPERSRVLAQTWSLLQPGGRLVITDLSMVQGRGLRFLLPFAYWYSRRGLLGKPDTEPWRALERLSGAVETQRISLFGLGHFFICAATKAAV